MHSWYIGAAFYIDPYGYPYGFGVQCTLFPMEI